MGKNPHWKERVKFQWSNKKKKDKGNFLNFSFFFFLLSPNLSLSIFLHFLGEQQSFFLIKEIIAKAKNCLKLLGQQEWLVQLIALTLQKHLACCLQPVRSRLPLRME